MSELMNDGFNLMIFGMGTVFAFLTLLVFITATMSRLVNSLGGEEESDADKILPIAPTTTSVDPQLVKVLSVAVKEYKSRR